MEPEVVQDPQDFLEHQDLTDRQEHRAAQAYKVLLVLWVSMVLTV